MDQLIERIGFACYTQVIIDIWSCILLTIVICVLIMEAKKSPRKRVELFLFFDMFLFLFCSIIMHLMLGRTDINGRLLTNISTLIYFILEPIMIFFLCRLIKLSIRSGHFQCMISGILVNIVQVLMIFTLTLPIINQFNGFLYIYDQNNNYVRTPCIVIYYLITIAGLILNTIGIILERKNIDQDAITLLLIYTSTCMVGGVIDYFVRGIEIINISMTLAFLINFLLHEKVEIRDKLERERRVEKMQTNVMLSQIQPHFLYNCLTSIVYITESDPKKARRALIDFSRFLRKNLDSIRRESLVPFSDEIDHTKVYLSLEKLRFEDDLQVEYDIKDKDFKLPTLSVQSLVENAVKHGIHKSDSGSGIVRITSRLEEDEHIITISDNGAGFDTSKFENSGDKHIGIFNVRARIQNECNGTLKIISSPGKGTECTITIPAAVSAKRR